MYDAIVIGGGFYGTAIANYLVTRRGFSSVVLIEREAELLRRSSVHNQARVHNGYHYPRSFTTAFRSRINLPRFVADYPEAMKQDFTKLYAIARHNSQVTSRQFERFCKEIGASLHPAPPGLRSLFEPRLISDLYLVEEYAFDASRLRQRAHRDLDDAGVELRLNRRVAQIRQEKQGLSVQCDDGQALSTRYLFNCTYSGMNQFLGDFPGTKTRLKHEITEMLLVEPPPELANIGVTIMDGPFFSFMPYPSRGLHTLSHVRYTPHYSWIDEPGVDPYQRLSEYSQPSRVERMFRDAARYMPDIASARYVESLVEVKTILMKNEGDDGRPILFEKTLDLPNAYSILGSKIDNIYDVLEKLDAEPLSLS